MRENKEACGERTLRLVEEQPIVKISGLSKAFGEKKVLDSIDPVSYTHLDVYKRQSSNCCRALACCGEKHRMLYSTEKSTNSTTGFVKMVVESQ